MKILIIDDDEIFVLLNSKVITSIESSAEIVDFEDGELALNYLHEIIDNPNLLPDIILLDLNMPILDGWEFLAEYQKIFPKITKQIHLYLLSSSISPYDMDKAKQIPEVTEFVTKPLSKDSFLNIVERLKN